MARIRSIKPEFFRHSRLFRAEQETGLPLRVAYAGLWTAADREGRFVWEPDALKLDCLPYDAVDFSRVLDALREAGFIVRYGELQQYGCIPGFTMHQRVNVREAASHLPAPPDEPVEAATISTAHTPNGVNIPEPLRQTVIARDGHACVRCGATADLTVDHIFPRSCGGTHAITNLRCMCRSCNSRRPTAGDALIDDLAFDGLTFDDMPRTCMHVQDDAANVHARGEGKGREGKGKERNTRHAASASFDAFWAAYPRKVSKGEAERVWTRLRPDDALIGKILEALTWQRTLPDWTKDGGNFVPYPATWLNGRRWEDERPAGTQPTIRPVNPYAELHAQIARGRTQDEIDAEVLSYDIPPMCLGMKDSPARDQMIAHHQQRQAEARARQAAKAEVA